MTQQPQYPQVYPAGPPQPARKGKVGRIVLGIVVLAVTCFGGIAVGAFFAQPEATTSAADDAEASSIGEAPSTAKSAAAKAPAPTIDDGVWVVGDDMPAGTYKVTAAVDSLCYWEISKTGGTGVLDIVANDLPGGGKPQVSLKRGQTFKTDNCGTWRKV